MKLLLLLPRFALKVGEKRGSQHANLICDRLSSTTVMKRLEDFLRRIIQDKVTTEESIISKNKEVGGNKRARYLASQGELGRAVALLDPTIRAVVSVDDEGMHLLQALHPPAIKLRESKHMQGQDRGDGERSTGSTNTITN